MYVIASNRFTNIKYSVNNIKRTNVRKYFELHCSTCFVSLSTALIIIVFCYYFSAHRSLNSEITCFNKLYEGNNMKWYEGDIFNCYEKVKVRGGGNSWSLSLPSSWTATKFGFLIDFFTRFAVVRDHDNERNINFQLWFVWFMYIFFLSNLCEIVFLI